jgi:hypothetical protein
MLRRSVRTVSKRGRRFPSFDSGPLDPAQEEDDGSYQTDCQVTLKMSKPSMSATCSQPDHRAKSCRMMIFDRSPPIWMLRRSIYFSWSQTLPMPAPSGR